MSQSDDGVETQGFARLILDAQQQMDQARTVYYQERAENGVTAETHAHLHSSLLRYYSILRRYRDENHAEEAWTEYNLDALDDMIRGTEVVEEPTPGRGSGTRTVRRPKRVSPELAVELSFTLDDIAKDLGFAAKATESTPRTEVTDELIEEVEEWRKQNLDN